MSETSQISEIIPERIAAEEQFTVVVNDQTRILNQLEVPTAIRNCLGLLNPKRFAASTIPMTLERFIEVANDIIVEAQEREQTPVDKRILLIEDYPGEEVSKIGEVTICWKIKKRAPANMSSDGKSRPNRNYSFYYQYRPAYDPQKMYIVESRPIDHEIEFTIWSKSAKLANQRALWLERLFVNQTWAFQVQGVDLFQWKDRGIDTYQLVNSSRFYLRPLTFMVRLRDFRVKAEPIIQQFNVDLTLSRPDELDIIRPSDNDT